MNHAREEARRSAGTLKRIWWLAKRGWWCIKVAVRPSCERRRAERITARAAEQALRASLTQMVVAFQHKEKEK